MAPNEESDDDPSRHCSRRGFIAWSMAAGLAAASRSASGKRLPVAQTNVDVKTPDGMCDAFFLHPAKGSHPGVLLWHDSPGLRPVIRDLGKRIAAEGYSVLVPNLFYRTATAPVLTLPLTTRIIQQIGKNIAERWRRFSYPVRRSGMLWPTWHSWTRNPR